jgi:multidrug efflux pump subunit AcrA (membrane-fusion protein)
MSTVKAVRRAPVCATLVASLGLASLILAGCRAKDAAEPVRVVTVDVAPVLNSKIERVIRVDGLLYPVQQAAIVPKVSAPVKKVYVERGARVHVGQLLVELENQDLVNAAQEAQAAYTLAEATFETTAKATVPQELQKAELDLRAAKDGLDAQQGVFDSRQSLAKEGAIAQKDVNEAQFNLSQARSLYEVARKHLDDLQKFASETALKAATAQRDQAKAHRDAANAQLGYSRLTSPIDGVVTDRPVYAGETVAAGAPVVTVMDVSQVIARAHVSPAEAAELKVGNPANIIGPGGIPVAGKVTQISPALDSTSTTVEVWVQADNASAQLMPGASLRVEMIAKTAPRALVIPLAAVITSRSGATSAVVVDAENRPHKTTVSLGIRDNGKVEVTDGLESGQRVVTTGAFELAKLDAEVFKKTTVQIQPPKEEEEDDAN